jgi:hypothetical protein
MKAHICSVVEDIDNMYIVKCMVAAGAFCAIYRCVSMYRKLGVDDPPFHNIPAGSLPPTPSHPSASSHSQA